jgi:hypothetical protein
VDGLVAAAVVLARDVLGTLDEAAVAGVAAGVADLLLGAVVVGHLVVLAGEGRGRLAVQWVVGGWFLGSNIEALDGESWRSVEVLMDDYCVKKSKQMQREGIIRGLKTGRKAQRSL